LRTNLFKTSPLILAAAAGFLAAGSIAPAQADAPNYKIQYNGLFDGYYLYQFNNPSGALISGRVYDVRHNTPTLALGELNVFKNAAPGSFGFKTTLGAGDIADINGAEFATGPTQEGRFKSLMQAYGTYAFAGAGGGIDFGKFYTPFGYELTESNLNFNESHSVPFNYIPFYNMGIRAYTPSYHGLVLTGFVVRSVYNTTTAGVQDDNKQLGFMGNVTWTDPAGKWIVAESFGFDKDKFNLASGNPTGGPNNKVTVSDTDLTFNLTPKQIIAADYTYAKTDPEANALGVVKATDTGWAVYYKQVMTPKSDFALRYSGGKQEVAGSTSVKPWEATATYEMHPASNFTTRLEYRHDESNVASFPDSNSVATKKNQDTLEVAGIFNF